MKSIKTVQYLAINGAVPVFKESLHVGHPNIDERETLEAWVIFLSGALLGRSNYIYGKII